MSAYHDLARTIQGAMTDIAKEEAVKRTRAAQLRRGVVQDNMVNIGGMLYPYRVATDMMPSTNQPVYCHVANGEAVIVGGE